MYQHAKENNIKGVIKWRISAKWGRLLPIHGLFADFSRLFARAKNASSV